MGLPPYGPEPYASANSATPAHLPHSLKRLIMLLHFLGARKGVLLFFCHCPRSLTLGATADLIFALRPRRSLLLDEALGGGREVYSTLITIQKKDFRSNFFIR